MLTLLIGFALKEDTENIEYDRGTMDVLLIVMNSAAFVALLGSILMLHPKLRKRCAERLESTSVQAETPSTHTTKVAPTETQSSEAAGKGAGTSVAEDRAWKTVEPQ